MKALTRSLSVALAALLALASFPSQAAAEFARVPDVLAATAAVQIELPLGSAPAASALPLAPATPMAAAPVSAESDAGAALGKFDGTSVSSPGDLPVAVDLRQSAALKKSIAVGLSFAAVEFAGGAMTGTLALKADAAHLASDRVIDAAALLATSLGHRLPFGEKTEAAFTLMGSFVIAGMGVGMIPGAVNGFLHPAPAASVSLLTGRTFLMPAATAATVALVLRVAWETGKPAWKALLRRPL